MLKIQKNSKKFCLCYNQLTVLSEKDSFYYINKNGKKIKFPEFSVVPQEGRLNITAEKEGFFLDCDIWEENDILNMEFFPNVTTELNKFVIRLFSDEEEEIYSLNKETNLKGSIINFSSGNFSFFSSYHFFVLVDTKSECVFDFTHKNFTELIFSKFPKRIYICNKLNREQLVEEFNQLIKII